MSELNLLPRELHTPRSRIDRALDWALGSHVVGIDVTADALRAAHVCRHRGHVSIVQIRQIPLPSASSLAAAVHSNAAITAAFATLRDLLVSGGMPKRAVAVLGVRDPELVTVGRCDVPPGDRESHPERAIRARALSIVPKHSAAAAIGWEPARGAALAGLLTASMDLRLLDPLVRSCRAGGWNVAAVEPAALALRRLVPFSALDSERLGNDSRLVWIDVGGSASTIVIFRDGIEYVDHILTGTNELGTALREHLDAPQSDPRARATIEALLAGRAVPQGAVFPPDFDTITASIAARLWKAYEAPHRTASSIGTLWLSGVGGRLAVLQAAIGTTFHSAALPPMFSSALIGIACSDIEERASAAAIGHALRIAHDAEAIRWEDAGSKVGTVRLIAAPPERPATPPYRPSDLELSRFLHAIAHRVGEGTIDVRSGRGFADACTAIAVDRAVGSEAFGRALSAVASALLGKESQWTGVLAGHLVLPPEVALALEHLRASSGPQHAARFLAGCARHIEDGRTDRSIAQLVASFPASS